MRLLNVLLKAHCRRPKAEVRGQSQASSITHGCALAFEVATADRSRRGPWSRGLTPDDPTRRMPSTNPASEGSRGPEQFAGSPDCWLHRRHDPGATRWHRADRRSTLIPESRQPRSRQPKSPQSRVPPAERRHVRSSARNSIRPSADRDRIAAGARWSWAFPALGASAVSSASSVLGAWPSSSRTRPRS